MKNDISVEKKGERSTHRSCTNRGALFHTSLLVWLYEAA